MVATEILFQVFTVVGKRENGLQLASEVKSRDILCFFFLREEIIQCLCGGKREALTKSNLNNAREREEISWTNILKHARDDDIYCKVKQLILAKDMDNSQ